MISNSQPRRSHEPWHHQLFTPMKTLKALSIHVCCGDTDGRNGRKSLGVDRLELGSLSGDSQEYFGIFAASSTQTILSLSSGEAEFYGAVRCACRTLGLKSLMSDLPLEVKAELVTDSSACKGLCSRRGAGKIRHIHCPALSAVAQR